ncbi:hypothetical protein HON52_00475 [Candidatus Uhrbacteria bacterium]|jgi:hypothetical protein|nr:hypothetical protein [Candidatus Uhrbacteria bacterium]
MVLSFRRFTATLITACFFLGAFAIATPVQAATVSEQYNDILDQGIIFAGICDSAAATCECRDEGRCTLENGLQVMVNVSVFILAISGTVMLFMFVYGGMVWIFSAGRTDWVDKGKNTLVGALVGLTIIFGAYVAINVIISVLKTGEIPESGDSIEDTIGGDAADIIITE